MYLSVRILLTLLIATAVLSAFITQLVLSRPATPPAPVSAEHSDANRLALTDLAHEPSSTELAAYQRAISSIAARCPKLDILVETVRTRQALHDQNRRDESALAVLEGVASRLPAQPDVTTCSGAFNRYLVEQARGVQATYRIGAMRVGASASLVGYSRGSHVAGSSSV